MIDDNRILKTHKEISEFIENNRYSPYESVLITKEMHDEFNAIDYIDTFEVRDQSVSLGHGPSESIPFITAPSVCENTCGSDVRYVLRVGTPASARLLREVLKGYSEMLRENY